jgi:hypothetical protein
LNDDPLLNSAGAAKVLAVKPDTLKKWRQRGQGPDFIQYGPGGPVRYLHSALLKFIEEHTVTIR